MARDEWSSWGWRQTKAQECQMEIMLQSPRGIRHVINTGCSRWLGNPQGKLMFSRDPTKASSLGTERPSSGPSYCLLVKFNALFDNPQPGRMQKWFENWTEIQKCSVYRCHETTEKSLLGGIVFLIHSIEQMSQQFLARGSLIYCNYIGTEVEYWM